MGHGLEGQQVTPGEVDALEEFRRAAIGLRDAERARQEAAQRYAAAIKLLSERVAPAEEPPQAR